MTKIWPQTHKNPLKTHIEALKIQNFLGGGGGGEGDPTNERGNPPLEPLALDDLPPPDHFLIRGDGPAGSLPYTPFLINLYYRPFRYTESKARLKSTNAKYKRFFLLLRCLSISELTDIFFFKADGTS